MTSIVDQWIEEDYFTSLVIVCDNIGLKNPEESAHEILDAHMINGVLDTDTLDKVIDDMIGVE